MSWLEDIIKQSQAFVASQTPEERAATQAQMDASRALSTAQYENNIAAKPTTYTPIVAGKDMPQAYADMMNARLKSATNYTRGIPNETGTHLVTNPATGLQYDITAATGGTNQNLANLVNSGNWGALQNNRYSPQQQQGMLGMPQQRQYNPYAQQQTGQGQGVTSGMPTQQQGQWNTYRQQQPAYSQRRYPGMFGAATQSRQPTQNTKQYTPNFSFMGYK